MADKLTELSSRGRHRHKVSLFNLQGGCCWWCKQKMVLERNHPDVSKPAWHWLPDNYATFEHLVDDWESVDGKDQSLDKIALSCVKCNSERNKTRNIQAYVFYKTKFKNASEFHEFAVGKKPADFIRTFGVCPQFKETACVL